jgi:hypothetical protein
MRPHYLFPVAALMALASGAGAQTPAAAPADAESISSVQVKAPVRPLRIRDEQARQITGAYGLSNGWYLKVHTEPRYIVARIDNEAPIRLVAVAPYKFVSQDSKVAMEFNRGPDGEDMLMGYVPDSGLAWVEVASSPLARR